MQTERVQLGSAMSSTAYFGGLPVEILERIILELHYFDVCNVKLVSGDVDTPAFTAVVGSNYTHSSITLYMAW